MIYDINLELEPNLELKLELTLIVINSCSYRETFSLDVCPFSSVYIPSVIFLYKMYSRSRSHILLLLIQ
jgi:hypothetical protein